MDGVGRSGSIQDGEQDGADARLIQDGGGMIPQHGDRSAVTAESGGGAFTSVLPAMFSCLAMTVAVIVSFIAPLAVPSDADAVTVAAMGASWLTVVVAHFLQERRRRTWRLHHPRRRQLIAVTKTVRKVAPYTVTCGNAVVMVTLAVTQDVCSHQTADCPTAIFNVHNILQLISSIEAVIVLPSLLLFIIRVLRFGKERRRVDFLDSEEVVVWERKELEDLVDKQVEEIRRLKKDKEFLARKLCEVSDGNKEVRVMERNGQKDN